MFISNVDYFSSSSTYNITNCCTYYRGKPNPYPQLTIKGRWLAALGFTTGTPITITSEAGQLIIQIG
ncbi:hypothetical protein C6H66_23165 [Photorhabdus hindustanensis]|uniref:Toxin SymE-like domain-containing protein n=1 Tax=Photorhabdus hindustanensis TaxID=2918802 RepID=A0A2S8PUN8_9GAMM|nr:hypothetical protein C6H66_23165 [Photorhabdus hindustanensis]